MLIEGVILKLTMKLPEFTKDHFERVSSTIREEILVDLDDTKLESIATENQISQISISEEFDAKSFETEVMISGPSSWGPRDMMIPTIGYEYSFDFKNCSQSVLDHLLARINTRFEENGLTKLNIEGETASFQLIPSPKLGTIEKRRGLVIEEAGRMKSIAKEAVNTTNSHIEAYNQSLHTSLKNHRNFLIKKRDADNSMRV